MSSTAAPANSSGISSPPPHEWTVQEIWDLVQIKFGKHLCWSGLQIFLFLKAHERIEVN